MANESNSPPHPDPWSQAGREYWDAWLGLWQQGVRAAADAPRPPEPEQRSTQTSGSESRGPERREPEWGRFFEEWWRMAAQGAPPSSADLLQRIADQGKVFLTMVEEYTATAMRSGNAFSTSTDWERVFRSAADGWQRALGLSAGDPAGLSTF